MKTYEINIHTRFVVDAEPENLDCEIDKLFAKLRDLVEDKSDIILEDVNEATEDGSWEPTKDEYTTV